MADKGFNNNEFYPSSGVSGSIKKQIEELIRKAVNADWDQSDSEAPDYIKNKPFGTEYTSQGVLIEETKKDFDGSSTETTDWGLEDGQVYLVEWDGETYEVTAHDTPTGETILGNGTIGCYDNVDEKDNDLPFLFKTSDNGDGTYNLTILPDINGEHTYSLEQVEKDVTPLPDEFLPDNAATKEYVDSLLDNANALTIKDGIEGGEGATGNFTPAADAGDVYVVTTNGIINGQPVQAGDLLICRYDDTPAADGSTYPVVNTKWLTVHSSTNAGEADWNASEGEAGYIRNRTHYAVTTLYRQDTATGISESGVPVEVQGDEDISPYIFTSLYNGDTIFVKYDGRFIEGTWTVDDESEPNLYTFTSDIGIATIKVSPTNNIGYIFAIDGNHSIDYYTESVVKIDKKYLPDGFGQDGIPLVYKLVLSGGGWTECTIHNSVFESDGYLYTPYGDDYINSGISMTVTDGAAVFTSEEETDGDIIVYIKKEKVIYRGDITDEGAGLVDRNSIQLTDRNGVDLYGR